LKTERCGSPSVKEEKYRGEKACGKRGRKGDDDDDDYDDYDDNNNFSNLVSFFSLNNSSELIVHLNTQASHYKL